MAGDVTESIRSGARSGRGDDWSVTIALDCRALDAWPERLSLGGLNEVAIARGAERAFIQTASRARLELPDRWISQEHARLVRSGGRWSIADRDSRNGTRVNGEAIVERRLDDGDVIECGGTFLVARRGAEAKRGAAFAD